MTDDNNAKDKGLRSILRDRDTDEAEKNLDDFTVFQDVSDSKLDDKAYDIDPVSSGEEEAIAANPLMAISNQELQDASSDDRSIAESKDIEFSETENDLQNRESADITLQDELSPAPVIERDASSGEAGAPIQTNANDISGTPESAEGAIVTEDIAAIDEDTETSDQDASPAATSEVLLPTLEDPTASGSSVEGSSAPEPLTPNVKVRVSHKTDNQDTINSEDGFDFVIYEYGVPYTVTGAELDIEGVNNNAQITYMFTDENSIEATLDTAWNSVKNIEVFSDTNANVTLNNFVHTDVSLGEGGASNVTINGAKRGNISTASNDDVIEVNAQTNNTGWNNEFNIDTGAGDDTITLNGDKGVTGFNVEAGDDNDTVTLGGDYKDSDITLGKGSDIFTGGDGNDRVDGGTGDDTLKGGAGSDRLFGGDGSDILDGGIGENDVLTGGAGKDTYIIRATDGETVITDFGGVGGGGNGEASLMPEHDTIKLEGEGLSAENMVLNYDGQNTVITFEGVENFSINLTGFDFTDLDNLPAVQGWNIIFDGQSEGSDAYDVFNNHGTGQQGIWNKDSVTHLNNADNIVKGKSGSNDVINAMDGDDTISGMTGDDTLRGQAGNDTLYGDNPDDAGSSFVTTTINIQYVSTGAGYKNAVGAYAVDADGNILGVNIGIENQKAASAGDTFSIEVSGPESAGVGYFILSDGYNHNQSFFEHYDNEDGEYSFLYKAGTEEERIANINDDPADISLAFDTGSEVIILSGEAYHSNASLNSDGEDHVISSSNEDGTTRLGFEDLPHLGDADFNDVVVDVSVEHETIYTLPQQQGGNDRLVGGEGDDRLVGQGGDDRLEGGVGKDTAVFTGFHSEYEFTFNEDGSLTVTDTVAGRDGRDTLFDVEIIEFRDGAVDATPEALILPTPDTDNEDDGSDDGVDDEGQDNDQNNGDDIVDEDDEQQEEQDSDDNDEPPVEDNSDDDQDDDGNNGHGNDEDGVDESNPGEGDGGPNAEKDDNSGDTQFFELGDTTIQTDGESWLTAVDDGADDPNVEAGALTAENDNWIAEVEGSTDGQDDGTHQEDEINVEMDAALDLADIMPDPTEQSGDISGSVV